MEPWNISVLIPIVAIVAFAAIRIARMYAPHSTSPPADVAARFEALERNVQSLEEQHAETLERLDFAERLLSQAREERRIEG